MLLRKLQKPREFKLKPMRQPLKLKGKELKQRRLLLPKLLDSKLNLMRLPQLLPLKKPKPKQRDKE